MTQIEKALMEAAEVIAYAREFVDGYIDVVDGDYGVPRPNKAMQIAQRLDEATSLIDAALNDPALAPAPKSDCRRCFAITGVFCGDCPAALTPQEPSGAA